MIGVNQYLTWEHFSELNKDTTSAFEYLCRALFSRRLCLDGESLHSNPNHPGIEVNPVLSKDGQSYISFQAKFFCRSVKYDDIKESIIKAIKYYGNRLDIIYIYCNLDIKDDCKSYNEIEIIANEAKIKLELITGQSILDQVVDYDGLVNLYFGTKLLDSDWIREHVEISLKDLGKRYNPDFNVDTRAQEQLAFFLRDKSIVDVINKKKSSVIENLYALMYQTSVEERIKGYIQSYIDAIKTIDDIDISSINIALNWYDEVRNNTSSVNQAIENELDTKYTDNIIFAEIDDKKRNELLTNRTILERIIIVVQKLNFSPSEKQLLKNKVLFLKGEMGSGKSQLLATTAKKLSMEKSPVLLLLGHTYLSGNSIESQIIDGLGLENNSFEDVLSAVEELAFSENKEAIVLIDAINETRNRNLWLTGLNHIITDVLKYKHIKLIVSFRSGFESFLLSDNVKSMIDDKNIVIVKHSGLADVTPWRVHAFLSHYEIPFNPEFYLQHEMTNPLLLSWFCQTYNGKEQDLHSLVGNILAKVDLEGSIEAGHSNSLKMLKSLINDIQFNKSGNNLTYRQVLNLPVWEEYGVNDKIAYLRAVERGGIISSFVKGDEEYFNIGFNLIDDYLRADFLINKFDKDDEGLKECCVKELLAIDEQGRITNYDGISIFIMIIALYAIKNGKECIEYYLGLISDDYDCYNLLAEYYKSLIWRSSYVNYDSFIKLLEKYGFPYKSVWSVFIENATKEYSELNAKGLTRLLKPMPLSKRDFIWTRVINEYDKEDRIIELSYYIESGNQLNGLSEDKIYLLLLLFAWMLSSSNRVLRDRTSKAMIELLKNRISLIKPLLMEFRDVDDPYILQRLYGIAFGAIMKSSSRLKEDYYELVKWVYEHVFNREYVYPDILLRDYARLIVERYIYEYPEEHEFDLNKIKPPYKSTPIPEVAPVNYKDEDSPGVWRLLFSMKFDIKSNGMCGYGDFGRYVFQYALNRFSDVDEENIQNYALQYIFEGLGYSDDLFGKYDSEREIYDRHQVKRIERIGKKYQWIAMYNILARISDTHKVKSFYWPEDNEKDYEGPWNPYVRDFDPTLNCRVKNLLIPIDVPKKLDKYSFIAEDSIEEDATDWINSDDSMFSDFPDRFVYLDNDNYEWVSLYAFQENRHEPKTHEHSILGYPDGTQIVWTIAAAYICDAGVMTDELLWQDDFVNRDHSNTIDCYTLYSREYAWSNAYKSVIENDNYDDEDCLIKANPAVINVQWEEEYDASQDETTSFYIPNGDIINKMKLVEKDMDGVYYSGDKIAAFNLQSDDSKQYELLIRRDILDKYLQESNKMLFWTVVGEKQFFNSSYNQIWQRREGYYIYSDAKISGEIKIVKNR